MPEPDFIIGIGTSNPENRCEYDLYANGYLYPHGGSLEGNDHIVGQHKVEGGVVRGGWDYYGVRGWVSALELRPGAMVTINGERVSRQEALDYRPPRLSDGGGSSDGPTGGPDGSGGGAVNDGDEAGQPQPDENPDPTQADLPEPAEGEDAIGGGLWHPTGETNPQQGLVGRYEKTTRDVTIEVDPSDSGGVQEAFNRLPREIEHEVVIDLPSGTFGGNGSAVRTGRLYVHSCGDLVVRGRGMGATRVTSGINAMTTSSKQSHLTLERTHWDGLSQVAGPIDLRDCRFSGFDRAGANSTGTAALSGKNGQIHAKRCVIGDPGDTYGLWSTIQERVVLIGCTVRGSRAAINKAPGCDYTLVGCDIKAPRTYS